MTLYSTTFAAALTISIFRGRFSGPEGDFALFVPAARQLPGLEPLGGEGDRSDEEIRALVTGAFSLIADVVVVAENPKFLQGRSLGALPALMRARCLELGLTRAAILDASNPGDGAEHILDALQPGDLALLQVHDDRPRIFARLAETSARTLP